MDYLSVGFIGLSFRRTAEDGSASISVKPENIGMNTVEMTYQLKNPNITDVDIGSSIYQYEVLPK